jgi:hypothetical protein
MRAGDSSNTRCPRPRRERAPSDSVFPRPFPVTTHGPKETSVRGEDLHVPDLPVEQVHAPFPISHGRIDEAQQVLRGVGGRVPQLARP